MINYNHKAIDKTTHEITVNYSDWFNDCTRTTAIRSNDLKDLKNKFFSILTSYMGASFDALVIRAKLTYKIEKDSIDQLSLIDFTQYLRELRGLHKKYYDLNSPYKQAVLISSWFRFFQKTEYYYDHITAEPLKEYISDMRKVSSLIIEYSTAKADKKANA